MWSRLFKANLAYALGTAANSAAQLLLVPFLVHRLSLTEYGAWALFEAAILLLNMLMLAGIDVGVMREHCRLESEEERCRLAGTVTVTTFAASVSMSLAIAALGTGLTTWVPGLAVPPALQTSALIVLGIGCTEALFTVVQSVFRIRERAITFASLASLRMFACVALTVLAVNAGGGIQGALLARLGASGIALICAFAVGHKAFRFAWSPEALKRAMKYGLPLLPAGIAGYVLSSSDRYFLQHFASLEAVAYYAFAYKVGALFDTMINRPFSIDWAARRFLIATQPDAGAKYNAILLFYLAVGCAGLLGVMAIAPSLYVWLAPPAYAASQGVVPVVLAAYLVFGMSVPLNVGIMLKDQTRRLPQIFWTAAVVCTALNFWWIPTHGMVGAAWATLVANSTLALSIAWVSNRLYPIDYAWHAITQLGLITLVGGGGLWMLHRSLAPQSEYVRLAARVLWALLIGGVLGLCFWRAQRLALKTSGSVA